MADERAERAGIEEKHRPERRGERAERGEEKDRGNINKDAALLSWIS